MKPVTSRPANSEKYIICKKFKGVSSEQVGELLNSLKNWDIKNDSHLQNSMYYPLMNCKKDNLGIYIENLTLPDDFLEEIKNINNKMCIYQKKYIVKTLLYIKYNQIDIQKDLYVDWLKKYNLMAKNEIKRVKQILKD